MPGKSFRWRWHPWTLNLWNSNCGGTFFSDYESAAIFWVLPIELVTSGSVGCGWRFILNGAQYAEQCRPGGLRTWVAVLRLWHSDVKALGCTSGKSRTYLRVSGHHWRAPKLSGQVVRFGTSLYRFSLMNPVALENRKCRSMELLPGKPVGAASWSASWWEGKLERLTIYFQVHDDRFWHFLDFLCEPCTTSGFRGRVQHLRSCYSKRGHLPFLGLESAPFLCVIVLRKASYYLEKWFFERAKLFFDFPRLLFNLGPVCDCSNQPGSNYHESPLP